MPETPAGCGGRICEKRRAGNDAMPIRVRCLPLAQACKTFSVAISGRFLRWGINLGRVNFPGQGPSVCKGLRDIFSRARDIPAASPALHHWPVEQEGEKRK